MRVTFVLPGRGLFGGIRVVALYAQRLAERGHEVTVVVFRPRWPRRPKAALQRLATATRRTIGLDRDHLDGLPCRVVSVPVEDLAVAVPDGDAVLATHWLTADPVATLPAAKGRKFYFIQHYEAHSFDTQSVAATWRLPFQKLVVARWLADLARTHFDDPSALVVPNGVDAALFDAPPREPHDPPVVGFMYSSAAWKGVSVASRAIMLARASLPRLGAVSFGASRPVAGVPLPPRTAFYLRPRQSRIREIYASADIWLCASETEGFGLPPLEAMACRCVAVSTQCGGPSDFITDGVNGYLVDVGDADAMAQRMVELLSDRDRLIRMSQAAYETRLRFGWEQSVDLFEAALGPTLSGAALSGAPLSGAACGTEFCRAH